ncbi:MAG: cation:proton antiporter [Verrucomicrobiota bacterium]
MSDWVHSVTPVLAVGSDIEGTVGMLALVLGSLVLVSLLLVRIRQSMLVGYFICGVVVANVGMMEWFGGATDQEDFEAFGEFGVVLLMFSLGIEFSLTELKHLRRAAFLGGGVQVALTWALTFGVAQYFGMGAGPAAVLGVAVALSSTAVSMKTLQEQGKSASPSGRTALAIALFQDVVVVLFMLFLPLILGAGGDGDEVGKALGGTLVKSILFMVFAWVFGRFVIPRLLLSVSRKRRRELFKILVFGLCTGVAWSASALGLSLALGAFVAGLVVSESMYSHRVLADVLPFKDLFLTLFFVFVGLTVDLGAIAAHWGTVLGVTLVLVLVKGAIVGLSCRLLGLTTRSNLRTVAALCSTGEFSLVLMAQANAIRPWEEPFYGVFVVSTALSMALVPSMVRWAPRLVGVLEERGLIRTAVSPPADLSYSERVKGLSNHAIVCGYGPVGQRLHQSLVRAGVETLVVELNADTVRRLRKRGDAVLFADAAHQETWELAGVKRARFVAFTFPDTRVAFQATRLIREVCPTALILARARFVSDVPRLEQQGVNVVVLDEVESSHAMVRAAEEAYSLSEEKGELEGGEDGGE